MRYQTRLLILFAFLFATALGTRLFLTWQSQRRQLAEINADIRNVIKVVHFSTHSLHLTEKRDKEVLTRFINDAVADNKALKEISIVNIHQEIVASSDPDKIGKRHTDVWQEAMVKGEFHDEDTLDWYEVSIPIVKDKEVIGQVQASVLVSDASEQLSEINMRNIIITCILFILVSFASYFAIGRISRPLQHLVNAARRVGSGDLGVKVPAGGTDEYAEVATAFNIMTEKLLEQKKIEDRLREMERRAILSETAATLAHEIRNPLNLVNLTAGHLSRKFVPDSPQQRESYITLIENLKAQVKHLNNMVNDFLAVGKPMKLKKSTFSPAGLVGQVEMLVKQELLKKKITLETRVPEDLEFHADPEQMRLVLLNIVLNAIHVSPEGEIILITAAIRQDAAVFHIIDRGAGLHPGDFEKVFEPYFSKTPGGTGLGLTLARRIVEEHGGRITVENVEEKGACFTISIPMKGA